MIQIIINHLFSAFLFTAIPIILLLKSQQCSAVDGTKARHGSRNMIIMECVSLVNSAAEGGRKRWKTRKRAPGYPDIPRIIPGWPIQCDKSRILSSRYDGSDT
jgi:hypothetical protein